MNIDQVMRSRSTNVVDRELKSRQNKLGYHLLRSDKPCECEQCKTLRYEVEQIKDHIKSIEGNTLEAWSKIILGDDYKKRRK